MSLTTGDMPGAWLPPMRSSLNARICDADRLVVGEPLRFHAVPVTVVASGSRMRLDDLQADAAYQALADVDDGQIELVRQ